MMQNYRSTMISQYAHSPTIKQLIDNMNAYLDPRANMQAFYDYIWNIETAEGVGLDILGKIIGVQRTFKVVSRQDALGFREGLDYQPFNQAPFYNDNISRSITLEDIDFRTLIKIKALSNISSTNAPSINMILRQLFPERPCYVVDEGNMRMSYVFEFSLTALEYAVLTQSGVMPKPAGVEISVLQINADDTFGFDEAESFQPFDQGVFLSILS